MSLWRKRNNVQNNEQNQPKWSNMTALADNDLSIKSDDLSIKSWVGLTDEDRKKLAAEQHDWEGLCSAVEAKLKEKNT
jgi:hypothetical protein